MIFKVHKCMFIILVNSLLVSITFSDVIRLGKCPFVRLQRGFKHILFVGDWYEVARNPIMLFSNTKCNKVNFKKDEDKYNFRSSLVFKNFKKEIIFDAFAYSPYANEPAKMKIEYPLTLLKTNISFPYWVLYTDYDYAIMWSCAEYLKILHFEYFWIFSRKPYISEEKLRDLSDVLTLSNIDTSFMVRTEQTGCM
ncbi:apolipo D-like [Brachionus plicatilis]|uniref:Apolipoprotein D n=1 Tax=Brachionus plicatilis TaxID=10195 RepID=A0A3M7P503_BRAPC|nr:apolipo D-like [Brachionus plicatilis]